MEPPITRFLQEGAELLHQQNNIIDRLMQYLDDSLMKLSSELKDVNFNRVREVLWDRMSNILFNLVENGIEVIGNHKIVKQRTQLIKSHQLINAQNEM